MANSIRLLDYNSSSNFQCNATRNGMGGGVFPTVSRPLDASRYLLHRVYWASPGEVRVAMESDGWRSLTSTVPNSPLPPFFLALAYPNPTRLMVDWIRVRKYVGADPAVTMGIEQTNPQGGASKISSPFTEEAAPGEAAKSLPEEYSLAQNHPNPFNPSTRISFVLPEAGPVSLKVYSMLGQEVATLIDDVRSAGTHEVQFNASGMASGMYIYRLQTPAFVASRKLILMK